MNKFPRPITSMNKIPETQLEPIQLKRPSIVAKTSPLRSILPRNSTVQNNICSIVVQS